MMRTPSHRNSGMILLFMGLALGTLSRSVVTDGFFHGMLQGAAVALLVLSAYVIGTWFWPRRGSDGTTRTWLPSRDEAREPQDPR